MKNAHQISMDYNRVIALTDELDHLAEDLGREINERTNDNLTLLLSGWGGDNSSAFVNKISQMQGNYQDIISAIKMIADSIRRNAKMVYNAEMEALRLINTKSH